MPSSRITTPRGSLSVGWNGPGSRFFPHASARDDDAVSALEIAWWAGDKRLEDLVANGKIEGWSIKPGQLCKLLRGAGGVVNVSRHLPDFHWGDPVEYLVALTEYEDILNKLQGEHHE